MIPDPKMLLLTACLLWPATGLAQTPDEEEACGEVPVQPTCITPGEANEPFTSTDAAETCLEAVRNYKDAVNLHIQCRRDKTDAIVDEANAAIERYNCRAEARTDCLEETP